MINSGHCPKITPIFFFNSLLPEWSSLSYSHVFHALLAFESCHLFILGLCGAGRFFLQGIFRSKFPKGNSLIPFLVHFSNYALVVSVILLTCSNGG